VLKSSRGTRSLSRNELTVFYGVSSAGTETAKTIYRKDSQGDAATL
jgi:hypothetical protein